MRTKRALATLIIVLTTFAVMAVTGAIAGASDDEVITQTNLLGPALNGMRPHGVAEQRVRNDGSSFRVQVEDVNLPAGTVLNVLVNGTTVGTLTLDSLRQGELELNTNDGQTVPSITNGTTVVVQTSAGAALASGTFSTTSPTPNITPTPNGTPTPTPSPNATPSPSPSPTPDDGQRSLVRLDAAAYIVAENGKTLAIKVLRTGDLSREMKVKYATSNGTAQDRTDFTTAAGRLFFAPGEASKTINILFTDDAFIEPDETFTISLFDASNSTEVGNPGSALVTIQDDDAASPSATNPTDVNESFVTQQYKDFLNREPDDHGLHFYVNILNGCHPSDTECVKYTRGALSANFFRSPEFQQKGSFVMYLYMITLGQRPSTVAELYEPSKVDRPHYGEFITDVQSISDLNDDKAIVSAKKDALTVDWLQRGEVQQQLPGTLTNEQFVRKLEAIAGVTLAKESTLIANLNSGSMTRSQVLRAVVESPEVNAKFYKQAFVTMEYFGYLRRDPEPCVGSADPANCGYIFHNSRFDNEADHDFLENTIVRGFIESPEYRSRFGR